MNVIYIITVISISVFTYNLGEVSWWNIWFPWGILLHILALYTMAKKIKFFVIFLFNTLLYIAITVFIVVFENITIMAGLLIFLNLALLITQLYLRLNETDHKWVLYIATILILPAGYVSHMPAIEVPAEPPLLVAEGWYKATGELNRDLPDRHLISSYSMRMDNDPSARNAYLAAEHINQVILMPGKDFSFNKAVGERLESRGFVYGLAFVTTPEGTQTVEMIGGGICKTATALNFTVLKGGFDVIEIHSHSKTVSYAPPGEDTAVAWPDKDYVFRNNKSRPVQIVAREENNILTVEIWGL